MVTLDNHPNSGMDHFQVTMDVKMWGGLEATPKISQGA